MQGLNAIVARVIPARQRVALLLDFLGRQTVVELSLSEVALASGQEWPKAHSTIWNNPPQMATAA